MIGGKKYSVAEYLCVVTLSVGVVLFFRKPNADIGGSDLQCVWLTEKGWEKKAIY